MALTFWLPTGVPVSAPVRNWRGHTDYTVSAIAAVFFLSGNRHSKSKSGRNTPGWNRACLIGSESANEFSLFSEGAVQCVPLPVITLYPVRVTEWPRQPSSRILRFLQSARIERFDKYSGVIVVDDMAGMGASGFSHIADGAEVDGGFGQAAGFA